MEIRQKNLTPHVQPFKVTQGHWSRHGSISYLWLPISDPSNRGSISHRLRGKRRFWPKMANFSQPHVYNDSAKGFLFGIL